MNWAKRIPQWIEALRLAGISSIPWWGLIMAILSGPVPRKVWRARLRFGCYRCMVFSRAETKRGKIGLCKSTHPDYPGLGCGCFLAFTALWADPHQGGCWGYATTRGEIGWPPYYWPSLGARVRSIVDFIFMR